MGTFFDTDVEVRWSDMDVFRHVNHARMVTLLEEARLPFLFYKHLPTAGFGDGMVVADLHVRYCQQLRHTDGPFQIRMWITQLRAVSFTVHYEVRPKDVDPNTTKSFVTASTRLAAFDITTQKLRRFTSQERTYLELWTDPKPS